MTPYADFLYFEVLAYPILITVILGLLGWAGRRWALAVTLGMLMIQYGGPLRPSFGNSSASESVRHAVSLGGINEFWLVAGFGLYQWAVAAAFLRLRAAAKWRWAYVAAITFSLLPLLVVKVLPLFKPSDLIGFLGISYVTFRSLDVIFVIQDRLISSLPPLQYLGFLLFFPTISSGPIDRYRRFDADWKAHRGRGEFLSDVDNAVHQVFTGFLFKFILAALVRRFWLDPFETGQRLVDFIVYAYAYTFYLYFDFAGYSCFAVGLSYMLGIHTPHNFNRPFLARNIRDFWNRWHISLSTWFRDHVYMRFVLAAAMGRWFKGKHTSSVLGFFLAFGLMGLWHGLQWYYLVYGIYHAALLSGFDLFCRWNKSRRIWGDGPLWRVTGTLVTFHVVCFGFLLFSGRLATPAGAAPNAGTDLAAVARVKASFTGSLDQANGTSIQGWVFDRYQPDESVSVDLYDGPVLFTTIRANQVRPDLVSLGVGDGDHGFEIPTPPQWKDGRMHRIRATFAGTNIDLKKSPWIITCAPD